MNKLLKSAALTLAAAMLLSTTAFAEESTLPVRATLEAKGYEIDWIQETKTVVIRDGGFVVEESVGEVISLTDSTTYARESFFTQIDEQRKAYEEYSTNAKVTELAEGYFIAETEKLGEVMFRYDDQTHFHHEMNRMLYRANDLQAGSFIKVYFDVAMTASIPPQTYAIEVVFLNEAPAEEALSMTGTVVETGEGFVVVNTEKMGEVMFLFDENTNLHHEMNRMFYAFTDLSEGMSVTVLHSDAMTASIPPQCYASEIVIMNVQSAQAQTITTSGKISEIGDDYFIIESEESEYRFNVSEETFFHHVINRMLYRFESLEKGMEVEVIHSEAATFSLPPQSYATEVIIK